LQNLLAEVVSAYSNVQFSEAALSSRRISEVFALRTVEVASRRQAQGVGSPSDTFQAKNALAKARLELNKAMAEYEIARSRLLNAIGSEQSETFPVNILSERILRASSEMLGSDTGTSLHEWLRRAEEHPTLLYSRAQQEAAIQAVKSTKAEGAPKLDLSVNHYHNGRPSQSLNSLKSHQTIAGLTLTIPVFDGFRVPYRVRNALSQAELKLGELLENEGKVFMEVTQAFAEARSARDNLDISLDLLSSAEMAEETMRHRYELGVSIITDLIIAQTALSEARQERIRCLTQWQYARLNLFASTGAMVRLPELAQFQ
jgi:outer membrane protein